MASILDLIRSASGQPDINQQIATALGQAPGQPGNPTGPQPGAGAPAAPPAAGAPPAGPGAAPQAPQQPEAYQSQPDMAQLYFKFAQQQHADDMFNRGIAGIAAGFAPSWDRNAILGMGKDTTQDPGALFGNIMKLQGWQQQQQQYKAWLDSAGDVAGQLGVTKNEALAMGPDAARTAIALKVPPEVLRVRTALQQQFITDHAGDPGPDGQPIGAAGAKALFERQNPMSLTMAGATGAGAADPALMRRTMRQADWQSRHPGEPVPAYFGSDEGMAAYDAQVASLGASQTAAGTTLPGLEGNLGDMRNKAAEILKADPDELDALLKSAPTVLQAARTDGWPRVLAQGVGGMSTDDLKLLQQIDELTGYPTQAMKSANPHLIASIAPIDNALRPLTNFQLGAENFRKNTQSVIDAIDSAHAQAIGASGQLSKLQGIADPDEKKSVLGKVDESYLPGGRNFLGDAPRPPPDELAKARDAIAQGKVTPADAIRHLKSKGFLPRPGDLPGA